MGGADRIIRLVVAAIAAGLYVTGKVTGTPGNILLAVAGIFTLTALVGVCPLYLPFGIRTCKTK